MEYISTKELSELWHVSASRISRLANAGRIPGAKLVGKSWVFPKNAEKPADKRSHNVENENKEAVFHFPLYLFTTYSTEEFSEDENALLQAELLFVKGHYAESKKRLEELYNHTNDRYVIYGALYMLCLTNILLKNYAASVMYYRRIKQHFEKETQHLEEMSYLMHNLDTYFLGNEYYLSEFSVNPGYEYQEEILGYILAESAYSDLLRARLKQEKVNTAPYDLFCQQKNDKILSVRASIVLKVYLGVIHYIQGNKEATKKYVYEACKSAANNGLEPVIVHVYHYFREIFTFALREKMPELLECLSHYSDDYSDAYFGLLSYMEKNTVYQALKPEEYQFVIYAVEGLSHKEIADKLNLSVSSISKKYSVIFEKTGTHSKGELVKMFSDNTRKY